MRYAIAGTATVVIVAGSLIAGCGSPGPNLAACKAAMVKAYLTAMRDPSAPPAAEPASCHGVPTSTVDQYAAQTIGGQR